MSFLNISWQVLPTACADEVDDVDDTTVGPIHDEVSCNTFQERDDVAVAVVLVSRVVVCVSADHLNRAFLGRCWRTGLKTFVDVQIHVALHTHT